jgi:hypothetical protein
VGLRPTGWTHPLDPPNKETDDEYFPVSQGYERLRFWRIYGVFLPDEVLEKVYRRNAERLLETTRETSESRTSHTGSTSSGVTTASPLSSRIRPTWVRSWSRNRNLPPVLDSVKGFIALRTLPMLS